MDVVCTNKLSAIFTEFSGIPPELEGQEVKQTEKTIERFLAPDVYARSRTYRYDNDTWLTVQARRIGGGNGLSYGLRVYKYSKSQNISTKIGGSQLFGANCDGSINFQDIDRSSPEAQMIKAAINTLYGQEVRFTYETATTVGFSSIVRGR